MRWRGWHKPEVADAPRRLRGNDFEVELGYGGLSQEA